MAEQEFSDEDRAAAYEYARREFVEAKAPGVTRLDLDSSKHDGKTAALSVIPPEIADLGELTALGLRGTQVSDLAPLQAMTRLQRLDLDNTQVADLAPLQAMTGLQALFLNSTQVADLAPLQAMTGLQTLWLNNTQVADLAPLQAMTGLQTLTLNDTQVADLAPLQAMTELQTLTLNDTQVADLAPLQAMTGLQTLWLNNTQVADLAPLQAMTELQTLSLNDTQVADLAPLQAMTGLQTLTLNDTQVADLAPLQAMTGLQTLSLNDTQVADLAPLQAMTGLQTLSLSNTQVADLAPLQAMTGLQALLLDNTQVADLAPLQAMTELQTLSLDNTQVADLLPLAGLSKLGEVRFHGIWFSDTPAEDRDDAHRALAAIEDGEYRAKQVLQYLNGEHPEFGGPPEPYVPPKPSSPPEEDPEQLSKAIDGPFLTLAHTDFGIRDLKVTVMPFDHDSVTDPTQSRSHQDMLETLTWAADELRRLAELNQLGQRDASRLRQYIGYTKADQLNARLLQLIARSIRASIEAAKDEGRLQPDDQQIAEDFLLAHSTLIGEFYPEVLSVEARVSAVEVDESVRAGDILTPMQQLGGVLREEEDLVTPDLQQAFENLERTSEDYLDTEDRAPLMTPEDAEAARGAFLNFAKRTGATIGRLYLFVKKRALEITGVGGGAAGMEAQWQVFSTFAARLGEIWQKIAPFFPPLF